MAYADTVILMEQYVPQIITSRVQELFIEKEREAREAEWMQLRRLKAPKTGQAFLFFRSVVTENEKKIVLDDFSADITHFTALFTADQLNTLAWIMESLCRITVIECAPDSYVDENNLSVLLIIWYNHVSIDKVISVR